MRIAQIEDRTSLIVDATGVGAAFLDILRKSRPRARATAVTIAGGDQSQGSGYNATVPKRDLFAALQTLLRQRKLRIRPPDFRAHGLHRA